MTGRMRGWIVLISFGVLALAVGGVMLMVGLEEADKLGSVVGALAGVLGLGLAVYGVIGVRARTGGEAVPIETGGSPIVAPRASVEPLPPPRVELCLGRDEQIAGVRTAWLSGRWAVVAGGPGIGKSTVLGRALSEESVMAAFAERRYLVSCEGAASASAVIDKTAAVLGVELGDHLRNRVLAFLRSGPGVLVLDNFETLADADPAGAAELLATLRALSDLVVGIGARGTTIPAGLEGVNETRVGKPIA